MTFKYIQLNIWHSGLLYDNLLEFLRQENADILVFQEALKGNKNHPDQNRFNLINNFKKELELPHHFFGSDFYVTASSVDETVESDFGELVLSRFPITQTETEFYFKKYQTMDLSSINDFSAVPRAIHSIQIDINGVPLHVYTTHGVWGFDGEDNELRLKMSEKIVDTVKNQTHAVLSGDLNTRENTKTIANIEKHLTNVFKGKLQTTFNMRHKDAESGNFGSSVVDFVFASNDLIVKDAYAPQDDVSDHVPLVVTFEFATMPYGT